MSFFVVYGIKKIKIKKVFGENTEKFLETY